MSANASDSSQSNSYNTRSTQSQNNAPPSSQPNLPPAQLNPPSTQSTGSQKIWALQKGTMRIVGHGKKKPSDPYMMLQLEFNFENDPRTRKVGKAKLHFLIGTHFSWLFSNRSSKRATSPAPSLPPNQPSTTRIKCPSTTL